MSGKDASRGFVYQGFASVLEALCEENWDKIYIEGGFENDKVDITLEKDNQSIKGIQVKSTKNSFSKHSIKKWLEELFENNDSCSEAYELFLIGQCDTSASAFIRAINEISEKKVTDKDRKALRNFNTMLIDNKKIKIENLPFNVTLLEKMVRDSLHQYISYKNLTIKFEQLKLISLATLMDSMISSTDGKGVKREDFDKELENRVLMLADKNPPKRITLGIKSFQHQINLPFDEAKGVLILLDKFEGRFLKEGYDWNSDICVCLEDFLKTQIIKTEAYEIFLETHISIAFAVGRILDSKSGINIFPIQSNTDGGRKLWDIHPANYKNYVGWNINYETIDAGKVDSVLVLNATNNIYEDVLWYIREEKLPIGRIINCVLDEIGATNISIQDGTHASLLANAVNRAVAARSIAEQRATLHIFASAPSAFMFFVGQNSKSFGKCILYEYDLEKRRSCTYEPSIKFD